MSRFNDSLIIMKANGILRSSQVHLEKKEV